MGLFAIGDFTVRTLGLDHLAILWALSVLACKENMQRDRLTWLIDGHVVISTIIRPVVLS